MSDTGAVALHVEERGSGRALVCLHGFGGSARNFRPQMRAFSPSYRVIAFDARGHARSGVPKARAAYAPSCFVDDLSRVIRRSTDEDARVVLMGLSMGAGIALRYAIGHSDRIGALVLASFPRTGDDPQHREWAMGFADAIEQVGLDAAGQTFAWGARSRFDANGAALIRQGFLEHDPQALAHTLRELLAVQPSPRSLHAELEHLHVPTLLLAGSEDHAALESSQALHSHLPHSELVILSGAGHVVNLEAPEAFNAAVKSFLDTHAPPITKGGSSSGGG